MGNNVPAEVMLVGDIKAVANQVRSYTSQFSSYFIARLKLRTNFYSLYSIVSLLQLSSELKYNSPFYNFSGGWWKELKSKIQQNMTVNKVVNVSHTWMLLVVSAVRM